MLSLLPSLRQNLNGNSYEYLTYIAKIVCISKDYVKMAIVIFHMNVVHIEIQMMLIFGIVIWFILPNMTCFVMLL